MPFIEGEGSAVPGMVDGRTPVVAAQTGTVGNLRCVAAVGW